MSERFDSNLIINIKVSHFLLILLFVAHLGSVLLVTFVPLAWPLKGLFWVALVASAVETWRRYGARTARPAITGLELDREGYCSVQRGPEGTWQAYEVAQAVVHPWLVILLLREEGGGGAVGGGGGGGPLGRVIAADAVEPEPFRRLRARLRLQTRAA